MKYTIIAHASSKRPRIENDLFGTLHVYVNQPPLEGRANLAIIEALAEHFGVKKYQVRIVKGETGKQKVVEVK